MADTVLPKSKDELSKKQELNNHIVLMRKSVQQARVHVVHKLTKEITKLRERKGDEAGVDKARRKADRYLEEVNAIKNLRKDAATIFALKDNNTLVDHLQNPASTAEIRALARLSYHPSVQTQVKKYRDSNPHWALQIPVLLEKSKQKQKLSLKKLEKKQQAKEARPIVQTDIPEEIRPETQRSSTSTKKPAKTSNLDRVEGTLKVKVLKDLGDLEQESETEKREKEKESFVSKKPPRSSFFVGGVDETVTAKKEVKLQKPASALKRRHLEQKPIFRKGKLVSKPLQLDRRPKTHTQNRKKGEKLSSPQKTINSSFVTKTGSSASSEKLHPSWEAKKRQAQTLASFQGKKTIFQNDD